MKAVLKMAVRTVRTHFARFMAILLIVALSAGFFAGLKITTDAMLYTGESYFTDQKLYDLRLFSTIGFDKTNVEEFKSITGIETVEGTYSADALLSFSDKISPYKIHALNESANLPSLVSGRMPEAINECIVDTFAYTEEDIGKTITLVDENSSDVKSQLAVTEFTIVGLCNSPLYLGLDRGSTTIGSGTVSAFIYVPAEAFDTDYYTEINLTLSEKYEIYSEEYDAAVDALKDEVTKLAEELVDARFERILNEDYHITPEMAQKLGITASVYVLTRNENSGYVSFENDTAIIESVAYIFPVFFIAIAILVCVYAPGLITRP